jgi:hypothetical protein
MAEKDAFAVRARGLEEDYFRKREAALLEKVRRASAREAERRAMGEYHGVSDEDVLKGFEELGYNRDTVQVLHLVPILEVAWADGEVSGPERTEILKIAAARNVVDGSPAHAQLLHWLDERPDAAFFGRTMTLISDLLEALPEARQTDLQNDLLGASFSVASASGGFLGLGSKVSEAEKELIERFRAGFEKAHRASLERTKKV